jgi:hypothetical protein
MASILLGHVPIIGIVNLGHDNKFSGISSHGDCQSFTGKDREIVKVRGRDIIIV